MFQLTFELGFYCIGLFAIESQPKGDKTIMGFFNNQTEKTANGQSLNNLSNKILIVLDYNVKNKMSIYSDINK